MVWDVGITHFDIPQLPDDIDPTELEWVRRKVRETRDEVDIEIKSSEEPTQLSSLLQNRYLIDEWLHTMPIVDDEYDHRIPQYLEMTQREFARFSSFETKQLETLFFFLDMRVDAVENLKEAKRIHEEVCKLLEDSQKDVAKELHIYKEGLDALIRYYSHRRAELENDHSDSALNAQTSTSNSNSTTEIIQRDLQFLEAWLHLKALAERHFTFSRAAEIMQDRVEAIVKIRMSTDQHKEADEKGWRSFAIAFQTNYKFFA